MKPQALLLLILLFTISAKAQLWIGPVSGNIYYNQGYVGIGTSVPKANADISTAGAMLLPNTSGITNTAILRVGYADHSWAGGQLDMGINNADSYPAWIQARNPADYSINRNLLLNPNGGNIGIGTTSLLAKLDINAINYDSNQDGGISIKANGGNANGIWQTRFVLKSNSGGVPRAAIDFVTKDYNTGNIVTNIEALTISANGNIGIGTTSPGSTLDIKATSPVIKINDTTTGLHGMEFQFNGVSYALIKSEAAGGELRFQTGLSADWGGFQTFYTNNLERLRINSNGNVGIGTVTPGNKLDVNGTIRAKEIKVDLNGADFVFEKEYKLMPLNELEAFVKEQKHLPDVATAKEMQEKGTDLGALNSKLLQKVEELTLYVIVQNKSLKEQAKKNEEQAIKLEALEKTVNNLISK